MRRRLKATWAGFGKVGWFFWVVTLILVLLVAVAGWRYAELLDYVDESKELSFGELGDAMAPIGLLVAGVGLFLNALSVQLQRQEVRAQLEEMREATRFQSRREIYEGIERLIERINEHRWAVTALAESWGVDDADEERVALMRDATTRARAGDEGGWVDFTDRLELVELYRTAVCQGDEFQARLSESEAAVLSSTAAEETTAQRTTRQNLMAEVSRWHSAERKKYLRLSNRHAFIPKDIDDVGDEGSTRVDS